MQTNTNVTVDRNVTVYPKADADRQAQARKANKPTKGKAKASGQTGAKAKASKAKAKGQGQAKADAPRKRTYDRFGFVQGSKRSNLMALLSRPYGATDADVLAAYRSGVNVPDGLARNPLRDAASRGHAVGKRTVIDDQTGRRVLAYRVTHADDLPKGTPVDDGPKPDRPGADDKPAQAQAGPKRQGKGADNAGSAGQSANGKAVSGGRKASAKTKKTA